MRNGIGRARASLLACGIVASGVATMPAHAAHSSFDVTLTSKADGIDLVATVFKPEAAETADVPIVLHSHGWGGSRSTSGFQSWLDAGFGVVSFDQRGFGESGGEANVEDPDLEGKDVETIVDYIGALDWALIESTDWANVDLPNDPWLFAIGGSYGGGYQTIGALTETRNYGSTRFDALAPEITWHDLPDSLGPQGVVRSLWVTLLYAVGAPSVASYIHEGFVVGAASGWFPDGTIPGTTDLRAEFGEHSPKAFSDDGVLLDVPTIIGQGVTDNLFNLNQGLHNFDDVLTPQARESSLFVGYNGGHVLPEVYPFGESASGDPCSASAGGFSALSRAFFATVLAGGDTQALLPDRYNIASNDGTCVSTDDVSTLTPHALELPIASPAAPAGPFVNYAIAEGPLTIAGMAELTGSLTTIGVDARAFFGLSVGTSPLDARLVGNNVLPIRRLVPAIDEALRFELPGSAIVVEEGETLYLTVSSVASAFVGFASRTPGAVVIQDATVHLPIV